MTKHFHKPAPRSTHASRTSHASHASRAPHASHVEGVLSGARSGAGFVADKSRDLDILVPPRDLNSALPGDRVRVRVNRQMRGETRLSGVVTSVLERAKRDIVGTLQKSGHSYVVLPLSPLYKKPFHVAHAKGAKVGERVVLRFTDWTNAFHNPEGEIVDVIGPADNPSLDTEAIVRQFNLPKAFPPAVLAEAENVSRLLTQPGGKRRDLRDTLIITIDPATARDFDDAISLETDAQGNRILGVHIADVSHFVRPGSPLDKEARKRGTSVYLVDKVIPMLPEQLSNGVCSLRPDEDRLCLTAFITFNANAQVVKRDFCRSIIRSKLRLTYEEAMEVIAFDGERSHSTAVERTRLPSKAVESSRKIPSEARTLILSAHALAQQLRANRFRRAALDLDVPETAIVVDSKGHMTGVKAAEHDASHELIEECMVAANEAVSTEMTNRHIRHISRLHEAPDPEKLEELAVTLHGIGIVPGDIKNPKILAKLLQTLARHPLRYYASMLVLRSMKRAEYNAEETGHFGLGKKFYAHFTSPIRRYPDLTLHRQLDAILMGDKNGQPSLSYLRDVAESSTDTEYNAEQASRDLIEIKKYRFLEEQIKHKKMLEYDAVVVKVTDFGLFIEVVDLQVSGLIHISTLSASRVHYDSAKQVLRAKDKTYAVGGNVRVIVTAVNFDQRKVDFALALRPQQYAKKHFTPRKQTTYHERIKRRPSPTNVRPPILRHRAGIGDNAGVAGKGRKS